MPTDKGNPIKKSSGKKPKASAKTKSKGSFHKKGKK